MFDRLTESARSVMRIAREQAQRLGHDYIGTEHLLLALVQVESGDGAAVLESFHVNLGQIHTEVMRLVPRGTGMTPVGQLPFTPRAKKVLELSWKKQRTSGRCTSGRSICSSA